MPMGTVSQHTETLRLLTTSVFASFLLTRTRDHRYPADKGHQDYYRRNKSNNGYCKLVIHPKLSKVRTVRANAIAKGFL